MKTALITGVTGQDGAYLSELLLKKGYLVYGIKRRSSSFNTARVDRFIEDLNENPGARFQLHYGDMTDATNLIRIVQETRPDEIYNLAAQSHVHVSFETPEYTANADALGTLRLLEALRITGMQKHVRFYQASTSEMYGNSPAPQNEQTKMEPRSPYAAAKLYAYHVVKNYREAYGMHASNGILFNHESPMRGETFVTRKITMAIAAILQGKQQYLYLGNLDAKRDWGHARDYVEGMWMMLQQDKPDDYVLATGRSFKVRDFAQRAFYHAGIKIRWQGTGLNEVGVDAVNGTSLIRVDPRYYRPTEVNHLEGDAGKAWKVLGWKPETTFDDLVMEMVDHDMKELKACLN